MNRGFDNEDYYSILDSYYQDFFNPDGSVDDLELQSVYMARNLIAGKIILHQTQCQLCLENLFCYRRSRLKRGTKILDQFLFYYSFQ